MKLKQKIEVCNQALKDFIKEYSSRKYYDLLYDVISICAPDGKSRISNRKHFLIVFLENCDKLFLPVHQLTDVSNNAHQTKRLKTSSPSLYQLLSEKGEYHAQ